MYSAQYGRAILQFQSCVVHGHGIWIFVNGKLPEGACRHAEATEDGQPTRYVLLATLSNS